MPGLCKSYFLPKPTIPSVVERVRFENRIIHRNSGSSSPIQEIIISLALLFFPCYTQYTRCFFSIRFTHITCFSNIYGFSFTYVRVSEKKSTVDKPASVASTIAYLQIIYWVDSTDIIDKLVIHGMTQLRPSLWFIIEWSTLVAKSQDLIGLMSEQGKKCNHSFRQYVPRPSD